MRGYLIDRVRAPSGIEGPPLIGLRLGMKLLSKMNERVAKEHDDETLERHNNDMDGHLIFVHATSSYPSQNHRTRMIQAGLFSAISSAFIVSMESNLGPSPSDTTNAKILISKVDNGTFSVQDASLPVWAGPSSMEVWVHTLVYLSLSTSLLAGFGAVVCKQWLVILRPHSSERAT